MILKFLKTKIGISVVIALVIILSATVFKFETSRPKGDLSSQIGVIAKASVENALENGDIQPSNWEEILKNLNGSSSVSAFGTTASSTANSSTTTEELTATDRFARIFFQKYVSLKKSGVVDENTGTELVNQLLSQDYGSAAEEKIYGDKDITVLYTNSLESLRQYGNALGTIINTPLPAGYEQELYVITRINQSGNTEDLKKLSQNVERYTNLRNSIAALPVPFPLKEAHISLINALGAMLEGIRGMTLIETDPVGATKMIARYEDGSKSIALPLETIKIYFLQQGVSFSSNESGYILLQ